MSSIILYIVHFSTAWEILPIYFEKLHTTHVSENTLSSNLLIQK